MPVERPHHTLYAFLVRAAQCELGVPALSLDLTNLSLLLTVEAAVRGLPGLPDSSPKSLRYSEIVQLSVQNHYHLRLRIT